MPRNIAKATAISNAKISFVSLVDKAANKKHFLITKAADGSSEVNFQSFGRIVKADTDSHFVTGIVYEPMVEDTQGNYMTEEEIEKAAHWFMKNDGDVDVQHCFEKAEGCEVVESFVAKSDMEIEGEIIKKGTWLMTMEVTDDAVWDSIQKGDTTGFSMGGMGTYSEKDVDLSSIEKAEEPKGILKKLAKALGMEVVEKGAMKSNFLRRVKEDNFYSAWYALRSTLEGNYYNSETNSWEWGYNADESTITDALTDFNDIVTQLLTSNGSIVKSLEKAAREAPAPVAKAGKSLSAKNLEALLGINNSLSDFLSSFANEEPSAGNGITKSVNKPIKKEDEEMSNEEVQKLVGEEVAKAMKPVAEQLEAIAKSVNGEATPPAGAPEPASTDALTAESVAKMVGNEIAKAMEPVTKALEPVTKALEPLMKSRALPGNLNGELGKDVTKSEDHYMAGMF